MRTFYETIVAKSARVISRGEVKKKKKVRANRTELLFGSVQFDCVFSEAQMVDALIVR